jgi:hypothetical protein
MKNNLIRNIVLGSLLLASCTKLDVKVESEYNPANFPTNAAAYAAAIGPLYTQLSSIYAVDFWRMQELSTDEAIIPARDNNYNDQGQYRFMHLHTWTEDHPYVKAIWEWGFGGINSCNRLEKMFSLAPESKEKATGTAEVKTMRALFYFFMMDNYGNIPINTEFPVITPPAQSKRPEVFAFIEKELKAAIPFLSTATGATTYGRPTKWMAFTLLEKMYLNAEYYTGTPRYNEAVAMADSVLSSKDELGKPKFELDEYTAIFKAENGPAIKDIIFAVPYDANLIQGNHFSRFGLHPALTEKYGLPFRPSVAMSTLAEFYDKFNLPGDVRTTTWLVGKQYNFDGSPVILKTTKKGLDANYAGADGTAAIDWHFEFGRDLKLVSPANMDIGNDELAKAAGIRSVKYYPDKNTNSSTRYQGNDVPVFRLADVILMKAEAILRGAAITTVNGETQSEVVLVNKVRGRAKAPLVGGITLNELLDERAREFSWEAWRRNDLIRFGKFESDWGFKTAIASVVNPVPANQTYRRIFPIPASERALNPKIEQNPGYTK